MQISQDYSICKQLFLPIFQNNQQNKCTFLLDYISMNQANMSSQLSNINVFASDYIQMQCLTTRKQKLNAHINDDKRKNMLIS